MEGTNTDALAVLGWIFLLMVILWFLAYMLFSFLLNKLNKMVYGKKTILAWIPFANNYVLGKLTVNKVFGWVMLILSLFNSSIIYYVFTGPLMLLGLIFKSSWLINLYAIIIDSWGKIFKLPEMVISIIVNLDNLLLLVVMVLGIIKYHKLSKAKKMEKLNNGQSVNIIGNIIDEKNNIDSVINNKNIEKL